MKNEFNNLLCTYYFKINFFYQCIILDDILVKYDIKK